MVRFNMFRINTEQFAILENQLPTGEVTLNENGDPLKFQGKEKLIDYYKSNEDAYKELFKKVSEKVEER